VVFDPFVGTGTTAVAAKRLGRKYIGIDLDKKYVDIARKNIDKTIETKIRGKYLSIYLNQIRTLRDKDFKDILKDRHCNFQENHRLFLEVKHIGMPKSTFINKELVLS